MELRIMRSRDTNEKINRIFVGIELPELLQGDLCIVEDKANSN